MLKPPTQLVQDGRDEGKEASYSCFSNFSDAWLIKTPQVGHGEADPAESLFSLHGSARQRHLNVCNGLTEHGDS